MATIEASSPPTGDADMRIDFAEIAGLRPSEATLRGPEAPAVAGEAGGVSFEQILRRSVEEASAMNAVAEEKALALASGASDDLHGTMIAGAEADISMKLVGSVRNKLVDAFHELWRTTI